MNWSVEVRCVLCLYLFRRRLERRWVVCVGLGREFLIIKSVIVLVVLFDCILLYLGVYDE